MTHGDTIVAISSAVGPAARMIVRASGAAAGALLARLTELDLTPAAARRARVRCAALDLPASIYTFVGPHSATGEDVVEFHIPGNPLLARLLLDELIRLGARQADPGEFTARGYFNGRLDLAQAEGVAATIAAHSQAELRAARQLLVGELARRLRPATDAVAETLALVEAGIDFADEGMSFLPHAQVRERLREADASLAALVAESARFERLTHEPQILLVGRPNAGKSTLLNALAGEGRAVVSPQAGTTRDAVSAPISLRRGIVRMVDVAGLDEKDDGRRALGAAAHIVEQDDGKAAAKVAAAAVSDDSPAASIARQMRERALNRVESADHVVLVREMTDPRPAIALSRRADLIVLSKRDLAASFAATMTGTIAVSALADPHLTELRERLDALAFGSSMSGTLALNARHLVAIADARSAIARAIDQVEQSGEAELIALELRDALDALGSIVGQVTPDDVLGRIFSAFCIGK